MRMIDADAIEHCLVVGGRRHGKTIISEIIRRAIQTAPTVDAVPVIRCKDCKHFTGKWCIINSRKEFDPEDRLVNGEGFCAWAERRTNETD